jgi:hypothetical protein
MSRGARGEQLLLHIWATVLQRLAESRLNGFDFFSYSPELPSLASRRHPALLVYVSVDAFTNFSSACCIFHEYLSFYLLLNPED